MSLLNALKSKLWLVQRVKMPKDYVNPFGVADIDVQDQFKDIFDVEYMGAAEYEFGVLKRFMRNMIANAYDLKVYGHHLRFKDIFPTDYKDRNDIICKIYIIATNVGPDGRESHDAFYKALTGIMHVYTEAINKDGESVCKADTGSFYRRAVKGKAGGDTMGWLPVRSDFAWFVNQGMANNFHKKLIELKRKNESVEERIERNRKKIKDYEKSLKIE